MNKRASRRWNPARAGAVAAAMIGVVSLNAAVTGQWDFNQGNLSATTGQPLTYIIWGGDTAAQTQFGTTTALGIPDIDGQVAKVMKFPATAEGMGYSMPTPASANGGGTLVNQWTLILDVLYPADSDGKWRAIIDTDGGLISADAEFFVNPANGIGISGQYDGQVQADTWHRIAVAVDLVANEMRKYIDGVEVGVQSLDGLDGRWSLLQSATADLFADNDGDTAVGFVSSIQLRDEALGKAQLFALGGPAAAGIPATIPTIPSFVASNLPATNDQNASPRPTITAVLDSGATTVDQNTIQLVLDGQSVQATVTPTGNQLTITYPVPDLFAPESEHAVELNYTDSLNGPQVFAWSFKVALYKEVTLPDPIVIETFDGVAEEALPAGWVATNLTDVITGLPDLNDPNSDTYLDWAVISHDTLANVFGQRRLNFNPVVLNGVPLDSLTTGNLAYAESDHRSGNQVQVLISPDFDLSGQTDVYLGFHSLYEQNQDSMGAVEYSIDQGATWLPALYMLDQPDVITDGDGNVDAVATLTTPHGDAALGLEYGAFIGAPIGPELAPFISARVNDDSFESKRIEVLRLVQADGQAKVRLRFTQTGTASWYFGIDDVGFYSISLLAPEIVQQPNSTTVSAGADLVLSVTATGTEPLTYQWKFGDADLPGQTSDTLTISAAQAGDAGDYSVVVSNEAGDATSAVATVKVFAGPIDQDLVVHLALDGDFQDTSGRNNHGAPMGAPVLVAGQVGAQAVQLVTAGDYVTLGQPADLDFGATTDFSISFWTMVTDWSSDPSFIGNKDWNSGNNQGYVLAIDGDGHFQWNLSGPPGGRKDYDGPPGTFNDNAWHHIAVTFDRAGNATSYVDGQPVDTRPLTASANDVSTPGGLATNFGQDGTGAYASFTDITLDDLGIWRRVLTPQEVAGIHTAGLAGDDLSTVSVVKQEIRFTGFSLTGNTLTLTWDGGGALQSAPAVNGPWTDVAGAASPYETPATESAAFFRVQQ